MERLLDSSSYSELSVRECGREVCVADKLFTFTPKTYHLFHYVLSGKGQLVYDGTTYNLKAGDYFYIAPGDQPYYHPDPKDPWTYEWIGIGGSNASRLIELAGISASRPVQTDKGRELKRFFDGAYASQKHEKGSFTLEALSCVYGLFAKISQPESPVSQVSAKRNHIEAAKEFIDNNFAFDISVEDVAKSVGVSPNYLSNIFNELESSSPKRYLTKVRMEKAAALLRQGRHKIKEVAAMVSYSNQLHFSTAFRKYYGTSPASYKKSMTKKGE